MDKNKMHKAKPIIVLTPIGKINGICNKAKIIITPQFNPNNIKQLLNDEKAAKNTNKKGIFIKRIIIKFPNVIAVSGFIKQTNK